MVRGECDKHLLGISHLRQEEGDEVAHITIQTVEHILILHRLGTVAIADVAGYIEHDIQHICHLVLSHLAFGNHLLGKGQSGAVSGGCVA